MSTERPNTKIKDATQRWQASGFAKPAPIMERLAMLDELLLRKDLTGTEKSIIYYLAVIRCNAETGLCFATDQNIADALGVTRQAVEKCKKNLRYEKKILEWSTEKLSRKNSVSIYRFIYKVRPNARRVRSATPVAQTHPTPVGYPTPVGQTMYFAKVNTPEFEAWDRYNRTTKGKSLPRNCRAGEGWYVATQWPQT